MTKQHHRVYKVNDIILERPWYRMSASERAAYLATEGAICIAYTGFDLRPGEFVSHEQRAAWAFYFGITKGAT